VSTSGDFHVTTDTDPKENEMRKVIYSMGVSLDGFIEVPTESSTGPPPTRSCTGSGTIRRGRWVPPPTDRGCTSSWPTTGQPSEISEIPFPLQQVIVQTVIGAFLGAICFLLAYEVRRLLRERRRTRQGGRGTRA
jgi:hypothetical protein